MTPKYKVNPDLPLQVCITITGDKEYRKNCRRKDGYWYAINTEIVQVEGKWYTIDDNRIAFDHELKKYHLNTPKYSQDFINKGIVGFNIETQEFITGPFTANIYNNVHVMTLHKDLVAINAEVLEGSGYVEELSTGQYKKGLRNNSIKNAIDHRNKGYNIEDQNYHKLVKVYEEKKYKCNLVHTKIGNLLKNTTFGIELEACAGNLPSHLLNRTGTCICKDGSLLDGNLYPPEYVTVPLKGAKGIGNIVELCEYLKPRNNININCSFHLHLAGFRTSRLFLVALHSLCYKIQGDVFKMFPLYKLKPEGIKGKNYCKTLPKIFKQYTSKDNFNDYVNNNFNKLFHYLSEDINNIKVNPSKQHNRKNKHHVGGVYKWNKIARYHWLNMINSVFSERNTLEFRLHTPTFNATKIINWLLICNAICKYAERFPLKCIDSTKLKFNDILGYYQLTNSNSEYAGYVTQYLKEYVAERTNLFKEDKKREDFISEHELTSDKDYKFIFKDRELLEC